MVETFNIQDANGKKIHIFDQLNTVVDTVEILKYLLGRNLDTLVLKVEFVDQNSALPSDERQPITSKVGLSQLFCLEISFNG